MSDFSSIPSAFAPEIHIILNEISCQSAGTVTITMIEFGLTSLTEQPTGAENENNRFQLA